jgi:hypothetical protein
MNTIILYCKHGNYITHEDKKFYIIVNIYYSWKFVFFVIYWFFMIYLWKVSIDFSQKFLSAYYD